MKNNNRKRTQTFFSVFVAVNVNSFLWEYALPSHSHAQQGQGFVVDSLDMGGFLMSHIFLTLFQFSWACQKVSSLGRGCIKLPGKCSLRYYAYETVIGTLTGVAENILKVIGLR